ncbi:MAG: hypothetical protein Kow0092_00630 [Deferrisomatales bacterium]
MRRGRSTAWGVAIAVALTAILAGPAWAGEAERIGRDELKGLLGSPDLVVVDARRRGDWDGSDAKIVGAVRGDPNDVRSWAARVPKDKTVVVYCA